MILLNNIPLVDPEVHYAGETIPPKKPLATVPLDPNVNYAGSTLPQDKVAPTPTAVDPTNNPSLINIGGNVLPPDTEVRISGEKILAESQIIDGVSVFEHIARKPYEIEFMVVVREVGAIGTNPVPGAVWPFPQVELNEIWQTIWVPNTVQTIQNTLINGLGILEIIIKSIAPATRLGSKNIYARIKAYENQPGQTIILDQ